MFEALSATLCRLQNVDVLFDMKIDFHTTFSWSLGIFRGLPRQRNTPHKRLWHASHPAATINTLAAQRKGLSAGASCRGSWMMPKYYFKARFHPSTQSRVGGINEPWHTPGCCQLELVFCFGYNILTFETRQSRILRWRKNVIQ